MGADLKRLKRDTDSTRISAAAAARATTTSAKETPRRGKSGLYAGLAVVVALAAVAGWYALHRAKKEPSNSAVTVTSIDSLAVLPFVNASGDPGAEYLSEGITQGLINTLSQLPNLKVVSLMSAYRYKGKAIDPPSIGRELGVQAILTGRMTQQGDDLSISAELVDAKQDRQLWGKQYQRRLADVRTLENEITQDITENLQLKLSSAQRTLIAQHPTENSEAYQLYLQGRFFLNPRTVRSVDKAIDFFQQAIADDPNFALAHSGLSDSYYSLTRTTAALSPKEAGAKARQAAEKALELDPALAEAHTSMAYVHMVFDWDFPAAEREFRRAIELNPNYAYAHLGFAEYYCATGHDEDSVRESHAALALEPFTPLFRFNLGYSYLYGGKLAEAEQEFRKTQDMDPSFFLTHYGLSEVLGLRGEFDEALTEMQKAARAVPESTFMRGFLGYAYARAGRLEEARAILGELVEAAKKKYVSWLGIAYIYAGLEEKDHAYAALELAYEQGDARLFGIRSWASVHRLWVSDPRFAEILKKIGLPPLK